MKELSLLNVKLGTTCILYIDQALILIVLNVNILTAFECISNLLEFSSILY